MLDVSFWELLIIGAIALVVVGPERLPRLMRTLGLWAGRARASFQSIRDEVEREVNADGLRETRRAVERQARETSQAVDDAVGHKRTAAGKAGEAGKAGGASEAGKAGEAQKAGEAARDGDGAR